MMQAKKTVLHVGCGAAKTEKLHRAFRTSEWREVRLDIDPACQPDIVASMQDMGVVESGSVDAIYSSHNVEHLYPHEVVPVLREFHRVLKPEGLALVTLPDLQQVAEAIAQGKLEDPLYESPAGPIAPLDILYGFRAALARGNLYMAHRTGFTAQTLGRALLQAGFAQVTVQRDRRWNLWAIAFKQQQSDAQMVAWQKAMLPRPVQQAA
jgi:SAM-dependent methyltransferase